MLFLAILAVRNEDTLEAKTSLRSISPSMRWRLLGVLPLTFFFAQTVHYWRINEMGNLLWMCNIGNLVLALGLFFEKPLLIRISAIWTIPGLVIWLRYVVLAWGVFFSSTLAHLGGLSVGMVAVRKVGMDRKGGLYAMVWYLLMQLLSRLFTSPNLNVNLAHKIQDGLEQGFSSYLTFWLTLTLVTGLILWSLCLLLNKIWPARRPNSL
jgi:hypothetical protein